MEILGIDIGGSALKGAVVNTENGELTGARFRVPMPVPSMPQAVADALEKIVRHFQYDAPFGCTFPGIIKDGVIHSAANVDKRWVGLDGAGLFRDRTGCPVKLVNDADAAGIAEMRFGAGRDKSGVVILLTLGTGIGSAIFLDGRLVPNTELGHLEMRGKDAEKRAAASIKERRNLTWQHWAKRLDEYLAHVEFIFSPDLLIVGGGISKRHQKFLPLLHTRAPIVPAQFFNNAGIIGAAMAADGLEETKR